MWATHRGGALALGLALLIVACWSPLGEGTDAADAPPRTPPGQPTTEEQAAERIAEQWARLAAGEAPDPDGPLGPLMTNLAIELCIAGSAHEDVNRGWAEATDLYAQLRSPPPQAAGDALADCLLAGGRLAQGTLAASDNAAVDAGTGAGTGSHNFGSDVYAEATADADAALALQALGRTEEAHAKAVDAAYAFTRAAGNPRARGAGSERLARDTSHPMWDLIIRKGPQAPAGQKCLDQLQGAANAAMSTLSLVGSAASGPGMQSFHMAHRTRLRNALRCVYLVRAEEWQPFARIAVAILAPLLELPWRGLIPERRAEAEAEADAEADAGAKLPPPPLFGKLLGVYYAQPAVWEGASVLAVAAVHTNFLLEHVGVQAEAQAEAEAVCAPWLRVLWATAPKPFWHSDPAVLPLLARTAFVCANRTDTHGDAHQGSPEMAAEATSASGADEPARDEL